MRPLGGSGRGAGVLSGVASVSMGQETSNRKMNPCAPMVQLLRFIDATRR